MKKRILSLVLCITMLTGVLVGCGSSNDKNTESVSTEKDTQGLSTEYQDSTEIVGNTENNKNTEGIEENPVYTITANELAKKAQEFFKVQAETTFYSRYPGYEKPTTLIKMRSHGKGLPNITHNWDEVNFTGMEHTMEILSGGLARASQNQSISYSVSCTNVSNNMPDGYSFRYYKGTDARIGMVAKIYISSTAEHDSSKSKENEGYIGLVFTCCSDNEWEIYGIQEVSYNGRGNIDWTGLELENEDTKGIIDDLENSNMPDCYKEYITFLKSEFSDYQDAYYNMADFDGDGFKEVIYNGEAGKYLLAYYDGKVIKNELPYYGDIIFKSKKNILVQQAEPARGSGATVYFHLENGNIVVDNKASYFIDDELNETTYYLNDNPISKEEYDKYYIVDYDEWGYFGDVKYFNEIVSEFSR